MHQTTNNKAIPESNSTDNDAARLIALCSAQITAAIDEAFGEIAALSLSVLDSARQASALISETKHIDLDSSVPTVRTESHSDRLKVAVQNASMRLQFADRLEQRLSNVSRNLDGIAVLIQSTGLPISTVQWSTFLESARATFTMEQERQMFDAVFHPTVPAVDCDSENGTKQEPTLFENEAFDES